MNPLMQLLSSLKGMLGNGPANAALPAAAPTPDPSQAMANLTGAQSGMNAMGPTGMGTGLMTQPPMEQQIANVTGASAGPTAMGPTAPATAAPATAPTNALQNYAAVQKALQNIDLSDPKNHPISPAPMPRGGAMRPAAAPGPQGPRVTPSIGMSLASPAGRQLLMSLRGMMIGGGPSIAG
jgi:hypothetical protein